MGMVDTQALQQEMVRMISMVFRQDSMTFSVFKAGCDFKNFL